MPPAAGNRIAGPVDYPAMNRHSADDCDATRETLSARLDHEPGPVPDELLDEHLAGCGECSAFASGATALHRGLRLRPAEPVPDLVGAVLERVETPRRHRPEWARYALFAVALTQLLLAVPAVLFGDSLGASAHIARELGSWDVALAIGLLYAAWRPERASGLLPFAWALAGTMLLTAGLDVAAGRTTALVESHHLLELVGVILLAVLARPVLWRRPVRAAAVA